MVSLGLSAAERTMLRRSGLPVTLQFVAITGESSGFFTEPVPVRWY